MKICPLTGGLGAEISGADVRNEERFAQIAKTFAKFSVIVIRGRTTTPEEHLGFARWFGRINVNRFFKPVEGHPKPATVFKDKEAAVGGGAGIPIIPMTWNSHLGRSCMRLICRHLAGTRCLCRWRKPMSCCHQ